MNIKLIRKIERDKDGVVPIMNPSGRYVFIYDGDQYIMRKATLNDGTPIYGFCMDGDIRKHQNFVELTVQKSVEELFRFIGSFSLRQPPELYTYEEIT
jgi:hypothetical protein